MFIRKKTLNTIIHSLAHVLDISRHLLEGQAENDRAIKDIDDRQSEIMMRLKIIDKKTQLLHAICRNLDDQVGLLTRMSLLAHATEEDDPFDEEPPFGPNTPLEAVQRTQYLVTNIELLEQLRMNDVVLQRFLNGRN